MYIEVHTSHHITSQQSLKAEVAQMVEHDIARFADHVTHVDVHLDDENGTDKNGKDDIRCTIEARLAGRHAVAVTAHAANVEQATRGAATKLQRSLESAVGKQVTKQRDGGAQARALNEAAGLDES